MISNIRKAQQEEGFTLIELLVVVIIIGILAAIAIPVFLNQREKAWNSAVKSDLRNAATFQEAYFTDESKYTSVLQDLVDEGFNVSANTEDAFYLNATTSPVGYCMYTNHVASPETTGWYFSNTTGEPVQSPAC